MVSQRPSNDAIRNVLVTVMNSIESSNNTSISSYLEALLIVAETVLFPFFSQTHKYISLSVIYGHINKLCLMEFSHI